MKECPIFLNEYKNTESIKEMFTEGLCSSCNEKEGKLYCNSIMFGKENNQPEI